MSEKKKETLPVLPLKTGVLFPYILMPISVGRPASVAAVETAIATEGKEILVVAQRDPAVDAPGLADLFQVGTKAIIRKMGRSEAGTIEVLLQGLERASLQESVRSDPYLEVEVQLLPFPEDRGAEVEALHRAILDLVGKAISLAQPKAELQVHALIRETDDPLKLVYTLASMLSLDLEKEQALLEAETVLEALRLMHEYLQYEVQVLELRNQITSKAHSEMTKQQREYLLRQQLEAIRRELGEGDGSEQAEIDYLREQLSQADLPEHVQREAERELKRLEKVPPASAEYGVIRTYIEVLLDLPWEKSSETRLDLKHARKVLDEDHYDLEEVKERILEQLGVLKLNPDAKAPILCFVGPPGVGKTSLGHSIARATARRFERMSLGGLHDEAELRGHRRTYIGAMPGRIIQAIRRVGVNNPVLMLDEVDKVGRDFRGDPAAALLEILDPEQNREFRDNYLDLPFDLSQVFFIATANTLDTIPPPLLDRLEVLRLSGYSEEEKLQIAKKYLLPKRLQETGLKPDQFEITDDALRKIISAYTREAGVRQLERAIGRAARKAALQIAEGRATSLRVDADDLADLLGPERFFPEKAYEALPPGVAVGLAWTETGGEVLFIESTLLPHGKGLTLTGHLGEVMQESAKAAQSYVWSHARQLGIDPSLFRDGGVHIHVPAGAIPKDGPSAGVAIATALASLYTGVPVERHTAMTGEITLSGRVLPVGGIKEKVLAGRRAGIRRIILPRKNENDLRELPKQVLKEVKFVFADTIEDVLAAAIPSLARRLVSTQAR